MTEYAGCYDLVVYCDRRELCLEPPAGSPRGAGGNGAVGEPVGAPQTFAEAVRELRQQGWTVRTAPVRRVTVALCPACSRASDSAIVEALDARHAALDRVARLLTGPRGSR